MEIIERGGNHKKQITCEEKDGGCGCIFIADKRDLRYWKDGINWPVYECPSCHHANVDEEELKKEIQIKKKMIISDATDDFVRKAKRWVWVLFGKKEGQQ